MLMNLVIWNCRGAASKTFPGRVRDLIRGKNIHALIVLETRVSGDKAERMVRKLGFSNWIRLEATGYAGGIWLLWNEDDISLKYNYSSTQFVHVNVSLKGSMHSWWLTCVYGEPNARLREALWNDLRHISQHVRGPWLVAGDFNSYRSVQDKVGGDYFNFPAMRQFNNCIDDTNLIEVDCVGEHFTWEKNLVKEKIDWAFSNVDWINLFPLAKVHHLSKFGSDHRPLFIQSTPTLLPKTRNIPFKCQAGWVLEEDFIDIVKKSWEEDTWENKISSFQREAENWNRSRVGNIPARRQKILRRIEGVERSRHRRDSQYLAQVERDLWKEYNKLLAQEELLWYQKSRCQWLKWGDRNNLTVLSHT